MCWRHGANVACLYEGCSSKAQRRGFCTRHGALMRDDGIAKVIAREDEAIDSPNGAPVSSRMKLDTSSSIDPSTVSGGDWC